MIDAIIFDFDQTLVDTLPLHYEAYRLALLEYGIILTPQQYYGNIGGIAKELIPKLIGNQPCSASIRQIHDRKKELFIQTIEHHEIKLLETAKLLDIFFGRYKMAVGSAGAGVQINTMIDRLGLRKYFDVVITGDDVSNGKPDPMAFLLAAEKLDVLPERCCVFGDTEADIEAAKRAGMMWFDVNKTVVGSLF